MDSCEAFVFCVSNVFCVFCVDLRVCVAVLFSSLSIDRSPTVTDMLEIYQNIQQKEKK